MNDTSTSTPSPTPTPLTTTPIPPPTPSSSHEITLSSQQTEAIDRILTWFQNSTQDSSKPQEFKLGGYAGTGKTTVLKTLCKRVEALRKVVTVSAFTGKAVNVLEKKGVWAKTLHSLMYNVEPLPNGGVSFTKKLRFDDPISLVIVDEASMVSTELYKDLISFGKPVLFVGDPGQLEPVGDNPNLMREPDFVLSEIHRQAGNSPIITLANDVRHGKPVKLRSLTDGLEIRNRGGFRIPDAANFDQVIVAKNKTRLSFNKMFRQFQNNPLDKLVEGDKIIVLRNNSHFGVFNGMILFVKKLLSVAFDHYVISAEDEVGRSFARLPVWNEPFGKELPKEGFEIPRYCDPSSLLGTIKSDRGKPYLVYADFAYAITCHKSQGSEWDKVLLWDEWMHPNVWDMKRWRYTGITRAAKELTFCI